MRHFCLFVVLCLTVAAPLCANAARIRLQIGSPFVYIQIGHGDLNSNGLLGPPSGQVDEVNFTFPAGVRPGDSTPITGMPPIAMAVIGLGQNGRVNFNVTIDSSSPLSDGSGNLIPFSNFSWTTQDGDIPDGQFDDSASQFLLNFQGKGKGKGGKGKGKGKGDGVVDTLTFSYANDEVYPAGIYTGRVIYTITSL